MKQDPRPAIETAKCCATCKYTRAVVWADCHYGVQKPVEPRPPNTRNYSAFYLRIYTIVNRDDLYPAKDCMEHPLDYSFIDWMSESDFLAVVLNKIESDIEKENFIHGWGAKKPDTPSQEALDKDKQEILRYAKDFYKFTIRYFEYRREMVANEDNILLPRKVSGTQVCGAWEAKK